MTKILEDDHHTFHFSFSCHERFVHMVICFHRICAHVLSKFSRSGWLRGEGFIDACIFRLVLDSDLFDEIVYLGDTGELLDICRYGLQNYEEGEEVRSIREPARSAHSGLR
jgi:hypothetical protein